MPPQLSDDEMSGADDIEAGTTTKLTSPVRPDDESNEDAKVESDEEEDQEGEYIPERITSHAWDEENGELKFHVKWEGFDKPQDLTWESEENLSTAPDVLNAYLKKKGGRAALERKIAAKKGTKRARQDTDTPEVGAKRGRKNGIHPADTTPPASATPKEFRPPSGSWEEDVTLIDACEGNEGEVVIYLTWRSGHKTKHALDVVYKRCPQKMLKFYEKHLVFRKTDANDEL